MFPFDGIRIVSTNQIKSTMLSMHKGEKQNDARFYGETANFRVLKILGNTNLASILLDCVSVFKPCDYGGRITLYVTVHLH